MTRLSGVLVLALGLLLVAPVARGAEVLTNDAILTMIKAGFGEELIIGKIRISQNEFDLSTQALLSLKNEGVGEAIIKAMVEASTPAPPPQSKTPEEVEKETQNAIALVRGGQGAEAVGVFDRLIAERPNDDELKIWKALALLEQARAIKDTNKSHYKSLVVGAYAILQPLGRKHPTNADWNFAMAMAFWLNDRPTWAKRAAEKALKFRANFAEPQLLLGDLAYDDDVNAMAFGPGDPRREIVRLYAGAAARKEYEKALALPDLRPSLRAEGLFKLGMVSAELEKKPGAARQYWERAVAAEPNCRYGILAQQRRKAGPVK